MTASDLYRHLQKHGHWAASLLLLVGILLSAQAHAARISPQTFAISGNSFSGNDIQVNSQALFISKTLKQDILSLRAKLESIKVDDESTEQVFNATPYSETENGLSLGADYLYYDATLSVSGSYAKVEDTNVSDLAMDLSQEYGNGRHHLIMGFSHGWENDSELGMHNKARHLLLGTEFGFNPRWRLYTGFEFINHDGDLENFRSARRFQNPDRTQVPNARSDQRLQIRSINDIGKARILSTEINIFSNDWGQSGNSVRITRLKNRSERLAIKTHIQVSQQDESRYYLNSIAAPSQTFYSDHRYHAPQDSKEIGVTAQWRLRQNTKQRIANLLLDLGYTYIKADYNTGSNTTNDGGLIHLNLRGSF